MSIALLAGFLAILAYAAIGYIDAMRDAPSLKARANRLIDQRRGPDALTPAELRQLIRVEDPNFWHHHGVDNETPGAGVTTITQSLSKNSPLTTSSRVSKKFDKRPMPRARKRVCPSAKSGTLLDSAQLNLGPKGWMQGMFAASEQLYGKPPAALTKPQWLRLVAALVAPADFHLIGPNPRLDERVRRIERLLAGRCQPQGNRDVMLDGCA